MYINPFRAEEAKFFMDVLYLSSAVRVHLLQSAYVITHLQVTKYTYDDRGINWRA